MNHRKFALQQIKSGLPVCHGFMVVLLREGLVMPSKGGWRLTAEGARLL